MTVNDYDGFARDYAHNNESNPYNVLYERPAIFALAGDVAGARVLDAGCGPGVQAAELLARGAAVTGVDLSEDLLAIARTRSAGAFLQHDLAEPLPFADNSFDLVLSSLVLHYLEDWTAPLREFHRVLAPGGRVVFSTHHPAMDLRANGSDDYLGTYQWEENWQRRGRTMRMRFWHRPFRAMFSAFENSDFVVSRFVEPDPDPAMAESSPQDFANLSRRAQFVLFELLRN